MVLQRKSIFYVTLIVVFALGAYFRASGLFRGLEDGVVFHPDSSKQVMALYNYLSGNYVQYYDSLYYDGYPYGLNRVDELFIRGWRKVAAPVEEYLFVPSSTSRVGRGRVMLYYKGRVLRVLYGMIVMAFLYASATQLWGRWYGVGAAAIYALAPLGSTVTHSVTGDIGVDLFLALLLVAGTRFVCSGRMRWFILMGAACGMGFVCKFQGLLSVWIILLLLVASVWHAGRVSLKRPWKGFGLGLFGFVFGVVLLNPAFLIDATRTWRYMRQNFVFIRNYNVPQAFMDLPVHEKMIHGLRANLLPMIGHIGIMLFSIAICVCVWQLVRLYKDLRKRETLDGMVCRRSFFGLAIISFSIGALFMATALKPMVQPFHFSFLLPTLALTSMLGISLLLASRSQWGKRISGVVFVLLLAELGWGSLREDYFWRRPENAGFGARFAETVVDDRSLGTENLALEGLSNRFFTERATKPVFRNRPSAMLAPTPWWEDHESLPYPPVPYPGGQRWIFMHGADFPRSTRMFEVPVRSSVRKTLVFDARPTHIRLGIQTGYRPARFSIRHRGRVVSNVLLPQHAQKIITLDSLRVAYRHVSDEKALRAVGVDIQVESDLGPVWVTVLDHDFAVERFAYFGADRAYRDHMQDFAEALSTAVDAGVTEALEPLLYYRDQKRMTVKEAFAALPGADPLVLPAGAFALQLDLGPVAVTNRMHVRLVRGPTVEDGLESSIDVGPGDTQLIWQFSKAFHPFDGMLEVRADHPGLQVLGWELKPDPAGMAGFVREESWEAWPQDTSLEIVYPRLGILHGLAVRTEEGRPFYAVRFDVDDGISHQRMDNAILFLHVKDEQGEVVGGWDIPLRAATLTDSYTNWHPAEPLPSGHYVIDGGVYHARNLRRFRFRAPDVLEANIRSRYVRLGSFTVE